MSDFTSAEDVTAWLRGKSRDVAAVFATRAVLRAAPALYRLRDVDRIGEKNNARTKVLAVFRSLAAAWAIAAYRGYREVLRKAAVDSITGSMTSNIQRAAENAIAAAAGAETDADAAAYADKSIVLAIEAVAAGGRLAFDPFLSACTIDAELLDQRHDSVVLALSQLWPGDLKGWPRDTWLQLKAALLAANENWEVWTDWYEDRLLGRNANQALEIARVTISSEIWKQGPRVVNGHIKRLSEDKEIFSDVTNEADIERRVRGIQQEAAATIGARVALRAFPLLPFGHEDDPKYEARILSVLRVISLAWIPTRFPILAKHFVRPSLYAYSSNWDTMRAVAAVTAASSSNPISIAEYDRVVLGIDALRSVSFQPHGRAAEAVFDLALSNDLNDLTGASAPAIAGLPLWDGGSAPEWASQRWSTLKRDLVAVGHGWEVWVDWFENRLAGNVRSDGHEFAYAEVPDKIWADGPARVNTWILKRIDEAEATSSEIAKPTEKSITQVTTPPKWDFFLSYNKGEEAFARWIETVLSRCGLNVFSQLKDMPVGSNFVVEMQRGLAQSGRFIALLSPGYVNSDHCQAEWSAAYNADPGGANRNLIQFVVKPSKLPPLAKQIVYKALIGLSAKDAVKVVLETIGYQGPPPAVPTGWPGGATIDQMRLPSGGIYEVAPGPNLRLERTPNEVIEADGGFTSDEFFENYRSIVTGFYDYTKNNAGNFRCSNRLKGSVAKLHDAISVDIFHCNQLALNGSLVWTLRMIALDQAEGLIPQNDELSYHASDLLGVYNGLERIFPKLTAYRKMNARQRFEPPSADVERAIGSVFNSFGNPSITEDALSPNLSQELKQAGEEIEDARRLAEVEATDKTSDITIETHTDAATRSLAVWSWLSNASEKLAKSGKTANDIAKAIERYEKLYNTLSPQMASYIEYLLKWFF